MDKSSVQNMYLTNQTDRETYDIVVPDEPKCPNSANAEKVTAAGKSDGTKLTGRHCGCRKSSWQGYDRWNTTLACAQNLEQPTDIWSCVTFSLA